MSNEGEWDVAFERVESYLRAHQLRSRRQVARLSGEILAAARSAQLPEETPVAAAMRVTDARIGAWLSGILGDSAQRPRTRVGVQGRLALVIADVPARWPEYFLATEALPAELIAAMREAYLEAGPELKFSNMAPRPIELGPLADFAGDTWETLQRWPWFRTVAGWVGFLLLAVTIWVVTR